MANTVIQLKHSTLTGNVPTSLANGEISINNRDGKFFYSTPAGVIVTHYPYSGPAGLDTEIQFNDSGVLGSDSGLTYNKTTDALTVAGQINGSTLKSTQSSGDEGGQLDLATAATNTTLLGGYVNIDVYQNKLRIFEAGGTNRGVFIDMANSASAGVGTDLLNPTATPDTIARGSANAAYNHANSAFDKANTDVTNISVTAGVYGNATYIPVITLAANGRVSSITNTAILDSSTDQYARDTANAGFNKANTAAVAANTPSHVANSASSYANSAFLRANNSLNVNTGGTVTGTITADSFITTGSYGNILGANNIYANNFIANTGFIQFSDGTRQYTANAGSGDQYARDTANAGFTKANTVANTAQAAFDKANTDVTNVNVTNGTYGNSTYTPIVTVAANGRVTNITTVETSGSSGGTTNFGDYFPQNTDWGYYDDELYSAFGESLLIKYDCRIDPITPSGYTLTKDFGYIT